MGYKIYDEILRVANDEFKRIYKVNMNKKFKNNEILPAEIAKRYSVVISLAAIINYHNLLKSKLLLHGIDIGELTDDYNINW